MSLDNSYDGMVAEFIALHAHLFSIILISLLQHYLNLGMYEENFSFISDSVFVAHAYIAKPKAYQL